MKTASPLRFAILGTRGIPAQYGGFETFADELSGRLVEKGIEVTVYCVSGKQDRPQSYNNVKLAYVPSPPAGPLTTVLFDLFCLWHARKTYDVVYMLGYGAALFAFIPRLWGTKVWINVDGIEWARAKWNFVAKTYFKIMETLAVRIADIVIADAEGIESFLQERHGRLASCRVIPYGAPLIELSQEQARLGAWGVRAGEYYLVVCRLEPENHVLEILQGYAASKSEYPLLVVGNHQTATGYVSMLKAVKDDRIRFLGAVYDRQKLQMLRCFSRAYLHGHSVGGTNPSLLEALGCGNVIIAHDNVFNREVAANAALYFKNGQDIPRLITRVDEMSQEEKHGFSLKAKERIASNYTWEIILEKYLALLHDATQGSRNMNS